MIYATIQYRKEDESGLYPARNFVDVNFNGNKTETEALDRLFQIIATLPQDIANAELQIIAQKKKEAREKIAKALKEKQRGLIETIKKLYREYEPTSFAQRIIELKNTDNTPEVFKELRNMLAGLEFNPGTTSYSPDRVFIEGFTYEGSQERLLQRIQEAISKYEKLKQSYILDLNLKYGINAQQLVSGEEE